MRGKVSQGMEENEDGERKGVRRRAPCIMPLSTPAAPLPTSISPNTHRRQSCPTLCDPADGSPPGSPIPGILQARTLGCHFLLQCMKVKSESEVAQSCRLLATPWTAAYQAPPSVGFFRQECWSGVPLPSWLCRNKYIYNLEYYTAVKDELS